MKVHSALGPGLLESAYQECLSFELVKAGLFVEKQKPMPLVYSEVKLECGYRLDIMVERRLILEIKSVDAINDIHLAQVLTYLKLANCGLALIMNFNVVHLRDGIKRVVNRYEGSGQFLKTSASSTKGSAAALQTSAPSAKTSASSAVNFRSRQIQP